MSGLTNATRLAVGGEHACAIRADTSVVCWGENARRQLGDGSNMDRSTPVVVAGLTGAVDISAGGEHTCVVRGGAVVSCWGRNNQDQLGTGGGDRGTPMDVPGVSGAMAVAAGTAHTCALLGTGAVSCWGDNDAGELGRGATSDRSVTPMDVMSLANARGITAGNAFTCAVRDGGTASCWGDNSAGQLGDGTTTPSSVPVTVMMATDVARLTAGGDHVCLRTRTSSALACWGLNGAGQLGDGTTSDRRTPGALLAMPTGVASVSAGAQHTCATRTTGAPLCWGLGGSGQLGNDATGNSTTPVSVLGAP